MANQSEVARLLALIDTEYEAGQRVLNSPAHSSSHKFITARMENIGKIHHQISEIVGGEIPAMALIAEHMDQ